MPTKDTLSAYYVRIKQTCKKCGNAFNGRAVNLMFRDFKGGLCGKCLHYEKRVISYQRMLRRKQMKKGKVCK